MQMTKITGGIEQQSAHYAAVRNRLRHTPPVKNRLKEVLAAAEQRAANLAAQADKLREERDRLRAEAKRIDRKAHSPYVIEAHRRQRVHVEKGRMKFLAKHKEEAKDFGNKLKYCPFTPEKSPSLLSAVTVILDTFRVTWLELVGSGRAPHVVTARATLYNLLSEVGFTWYGIAKITGHSTVSYPLAARNLAEKFKELCHNSYCFSNALACVKDNAEAELAALGVRKHLTSSETEKTESK